MRRHEFQPGFGIGSILSNASLCSADLSGLRLWYSFGQHTKFNLAVCNGTEFIVAAFYRCNFSGVRFGIDKGGSNVMMTSSVFRYCDFSAANLAEVYLKDTDFLGSCFDDETQFPEGFRPGAAGMVHRAQK